MNICVPDLKRELTTQSTGLNIFGIKVDHKGLGIADRIRKNIQRDQSNHNTVESPSFMTIQILLCF